MIAVVSDLGATSNRPWRTAGKRRFQAVRAVFGSKKDRALFHHGIDGEAQRYPAPVLAAIRIIRIHAAPFFTQRSTHCQVSSSRRAGQLSPGAAA